MLRKFLKSLPFLVGSLFLVATVTYACTHRGWLPTDPEEGWGECVSTGPQCDTDYGTQTRTLTCSKVSGADENCSLGTWVPDQYGWRYADKIHVPYWPYWQCPGYSSAYTSTDSSKLCKKWVKIADGYWTDPQTKVEARDCHTGVVQYDGCEPSPSPSPTPTDEPRPTPTEEPGPSPTEIPQPTPTPESGHELGGPPVCGSETPDAPYLKSVTVLDGNKVKLEWDSVESASHYSVSYGPESGNYPWGVFNTGNTSEYTVEGVSGGCFAVKAVNYCAPSELSNEVCTGAVSQVLGLSTTSGTDPMEAVLFWAGIVMIIAGSRLLTEETSGRILPTHAGK